MSQSSTTANSSLVCHQSSATSVMLVALAVMLLLHHDVIIHMNAIRSATAFDQLVRLAKLVARRAAMAHVRLRIS
jgi:hypothetical protein